MSKYQPPQPRYTPHPAARRRTWIRCDISQKQQPEILATDIQITFPYRETCMTGLASNDRPQVEHETHKRPLNRPIDVSVYMAIDGGIILNP